MKWQKYSDMNSSNILSEFLNFISLSSVPLFTNIWHSHAFKGFTGYIFVMTFSFILVTSNVQQPSYKHVTVCIFLYKYIFWSINNQNRPHTGGYSIQFWTLLNFLDLHNETAKKKCKAMEMYGRYNLLTSMKFEQPFSIDTTKAIFI